MSDLKIGDRVLVTKPDDVKESPGWYPAEDPFHNQVHILNEQLGLDWATEESEGYYFSEKWLTRTTSLFNIGDKVEISSTKHNYGIGKVVGFEKGLCGVLFQVTWGGNAISRYYGAAITLVESATGSNPNNFTPSGCLHQVTKEVFCGIGGGGSYYTYCTICKKEV